MDFLRWLQKADPKASKHRGKYHPIAAFLVHYGVVSLVTISLHDWVVVQFSSEEDMTEPCKNKVANRQHSVGLCLGVYFMLYFSCRLALRWYDPDYYIEFYKQTFLCSVTIFHAALGFYANRPILAQSFCIAVGIDQILWYVDLAGYLIL